MRARRFCSILSTIRRCLGEGQANDGAAARPDTDVKPVGTLENFMLSARLEGATAVWLLDGPGEVETHLRELETARRRAPTFTSLVRRILLWHVWTDAPEGPNGSLAAHVIVVRDETVTDLAELSRLLEKARHLPFPPGRPRWRAILLNPASARGAAGDALSALILRFDHALADGIRIEQMVRNASLSRTANEATPEGFDAGACARQVAELDGASFRSLPDDPAIVDKDIVLLDVPITETRRSSGANAGALKTFIDATVRTLDTPGLFKADLPRAYKALVSRALGRAAGLGTGNHFILAEYDALPPHMEPYGGAGGRGPKLGRTSGWRQILAAPLPPFLLRLLIRYWYRQFDFGLNVIPASDRPFTLGGRRVVGGYGVAPLPADLPLAFEIVPNAGTYFISFIIGRAQRAPKEEIAAMFRRALTGAA